MANEDYRPTIEYKATVNTDKLDGVADELEAMGVSDLSKKVWAIKRGLNNGVPKFLHVIGVQAATKSREIERSMVGHGRSGYVPTGNLMRSIDSHDNGLDTAIYPTAKSKGGTEYGGYVHDGTRLHPVPEPYMQDADKAMANEISKQLASLAEVVNGGK